MKSLATDTRQFFDNYMQAVNGQSKTRELVSQFVSDPVLEQHIQDAEAGFPDYEIVPDQIVTEGDFIAVRGTFRGTHRGVFAGIQPTGKQITQPFMIFYRVEDGRIREHWMQLDMGAVIGQLTAS